MKKKSIFTSLALVGLLGISGLAGVFSEKKVSEAKAAQQVAYSNFAKDVYDDSVLGVVNGTKKEFHDGTTTLTTNYLGLYVDSAGTAKDTNVLFTFHGVPASYNAGNAVNAGGYFSFTYGTSSSVGSGFTIEPSDPTVIIKSIKIVGHASHKSNIEQATAKLVTFDLENQEIEDYTYTKNAGLIFNEGNSYTATISYEGGISSLGLYSIRETERNIIYLSSIEVTYEKSDLATVTFDTDGGTTVDPQYVTKGEYAERPADPYKAPASDTIYDFDDWYTTNEYNTKFDFEHTAITTDTTIYGHWNETPFNGHFITFESNGGTSYQILPVENGQKAVKPDDPVKSSSNDSRYYFEFKGWYTDSDFKTAFDWDSIIDSDITLYAKWSFHTKTDSIPSGRVHYSLANNASVWSAASVYTNDTYYLDETIYSASTFASGKEPVKMHVYSKNQTAGAHAGFQVHKVNNHLIRNATVTITPVNEGKRFTYARIDLGNWADATPDMKLYANSVLKDTETLPSRTETTHFVEATFSSSENVTELVLDVGGNVQSRLIEFYLLFEDDPDFVAAKGYAQAFNNAHVCGTDDETPVNDTLWGQQEQAYTQLDPSVRTFLATYEGSDADIVECLERYDRVVSRRGPNYDFMNRLANGRIVGPTYNPNSLTVSSETMIPVIMVVTITSVTLIAIGLLIRRRKHQ